MCIVPVDQNTLKPQGSVDTQMLTPEQVRQFTDEWLRRLLALYRPNDNCHIEDETSSEQNQVFFILCTSFCCVVSLVVSVSY